MFSFAEFVERLGVVYCKDCDPEMSPLPLEANSGNCQTGRSRPNQLSAAGAQARSRANAFCARPGALAVGRSARRKFSL